MDVETLSAAIANHFQRIELAHQALEAEAAPTDRKEGPEEEPYRYNPNDTFQKSDLYWKNDVRASRFLSTWNIELVWRPQIVTDLLQIVKHALGQKLAHGVMVKGPAGIGKSHSLVNLVRKLIYESDNHYLVTFIPDCEKWNSILYLLEAISASCGIDAQPITNRVTGNDVLDERLLQQLIGSIERILASMGKQWIFVFDQINKLFVKPNNLAAKDASGLAFPFNYIKQVIKEGRTTSVISASVNNEMAYKETHEGFWEYLHTSQMTRPELLRLNDNINDANVDTVLDVTWGVPLFAANFVEQNMSFDAHEADVVASVRHSLRKLKDDTNHWNEIVTSAISTLLELETSEDHYDKKYLLQERLHYSSFRYRPLIRQVLTGYRSYLWDELMNYVGTIEQRLLDTCRDRATTNRVRGCYFEAMVIRRCSLSNLAIQAGDTSIVIPSGDNLATGFGGRLLPASPTDGLYFPYDPNFPAIDFFLKSGSYIFGIQVHVSKHEDVSNSFIGLCREAQWFQKFDFIQLIYMSPEDDVADLVASLVNPPRMDVRPTTKERENNTTLYHIERRAMSKRLFSCLDDLQWPEGCSLNSS